MSRQSDGRRRGKALVNALLSYGKLAAVPALIVGLLTLGEATEHGGFTPKRLAVILLCALVILALVLVEKHESGMRERLRKAQGDPADAKAHIDPAPAEPAVSCEEKSAPAAPAAPCEEKSDPAGIEALSDAQADGGPANVPDQPLEAAHGSGGASKAPERPSTPPACTDADQSLDDAVRVFRDRIIADIAGKPCKEYELAGLLWDDAANCFPDGMRWDGAWFYLDLSTGKLSAKVSTYPNQFGASRDDAFGLSASEFHRIAQQYSFSRELQRFETEADWARLFDDRLNAAVDGALAEVQRQEEERRAKLREQYAVRISAGSPKMHIKRVALELNQMYGHSSLMLTREHGAYFLNYGLTYTARTHNRCHRRKASAAEAAWIEERIKRAIRNPDASTWHSLPGGDSMNIEIQTEKGGGVTLRGVEPIRKYSDLLRELGNLVLYGSREADSAGNRASP